MTTAPALRASPDRNRDRDRSAATEPTPATSAGATRDAWAALAPAAAGLRQSPQDDELRVELAAHLAHLGLVSLAGATIAALPEAARAGSRVRAVCELITAACDDLLDLALLEATCRGNVEAMGAAGAPAARALETWVERVQGEEWFIACDGNVVRRERGESCPWLWRGLSEQKRAAGALAAKLAQAPPLPITLEGADPPWLLSALASAPARADGHLVRVNLVQADPLELLDGLALVDLREPLSSGRIEVFTGPEATTLLAARLRARMDMRIKGVSIGLPRLGTIAAPPVSPVLERVAAEQEAEHRVLVARIARRYAARDRAWWAGRYREATESGGGAPGEAGGAENQVDMRAPLRVLLPACRYSTFVRHASAALAASFQRAGCCAEILIEPDDSSNFSSIAYLRAIDRLDPDLIVLTNYTRASMGPALPENVPVVTWIQDAMAHLLDPALGAKQGELDFLVGHLVRDLFDRFGYPQQRTLSAPVVADAAKFHAAPVAPELRERFECEIALVSHHGEPPEALHARLVSSANADPGIARLCEALRPRIERIVRESPQLAPYPALRTAIAEVAQSLAPAARFGVEARLLHQYALPMADRMFRHETVRWAAELCERENWRLRLYGRGWQGGAFDEWAGPEVDHGEELRACYQSAAAHLHASINTAVHQRVMECALSGGLPIVRLHRGLAYGQMARGHAAVARRGGMTRAEDRWEAAVADHPEYLAAAAQLQRLGYTVPPRVGVLDARYRLLTGAGSGIPVAADASDLLGDLSATCFVGPEDLERNLRRAIEQPHWRRATGEAIAERVRQRWTTDVLAWEMMELVRGKLQ